MQTFWEEPGQFPEAGGVCRNGAGVRSTGDEVGALVGRGGDCTALGDTVSLSAKILGTALGTLLDDGIDEGKALAPSLGLEETTVAILGESLDSIILVG